MYAQMFGIVNKVARRFNTLYPEVIRDMDIGYSYDDIVFLNMLVNTGISTARKISRNDDRIGY